MSRLEQLRGKLAVVTGASSGIGRDYAKRLAAAGCDVVLAARRADRLETLRVELEHAHGIDALAVPVDLGTEDGPRTLFDRATADGRSVHVLINNAGVGVYGNFVDQSLQQHLTAVQVNAAALMELCHRFAQHMLTHDQRSWIHNVGSLAAYQGTPGFAAYNGTKAFVRAFAETLDYELRESNVGVSTTHPGGTYTEFMDLAGQRLTPASKAVMMSSDEVARRGLHAMLRDRPAHVPGVLNKIGAFLPRFFPPAIRLWSADRLMKMSVDPTEPGAT